MAEVSDWSYLTQTLVMGRAQYLRARDVLILRWRWR